MSVPSITLQAGQVLLTQTSSGLGITMDNSQFINGTIVLVSDLEDQWEVDDLVLFDPSKATKFLFEAVNYYLISDKSIFYKENYIPPS